ncbi:MAG: hypothetical protein ABL936_09350 [Aestuariivirga sp.]
MDSIATFLTENWKIILTALIAVVGGGFIWKYVSQKLSGSGSISNQSGAKAGGDIVGRDKITPTDKK